MKNRLIIALLILLSLIYAFGVFMGVAMGGKFKFALVWPLNLIRRWFLPQPDNSIKLSA